jgi:hypothetical protein
VGRRAGLVVLALALLVAAGCLDGGAASQPRSEAGGAAAPPQSPERHFDASRPVAVHYLRAVAAGDSATAARLARPDGRRARRSLRQLADWLGRLPIRRLRAEGGQVVIRGAEGAGVRIALFARVGLRPPYSPWVRLGERTLALRFARGHWRVSSEATGELGAGGVVYGLSVFRHPLAVEREHVTVLYDGGAFTGLAAELGDDAEQALPGLLERYGGDRASRRPVVFLVPDRATGERLAGIDITRGETPEGWQAGRFAYVDASRWGADAEPERAAVVVHELTHLVTRRLLRGSPQSLLEGVASYEQDRYLRERGYLLPLGGLAAELERGFSAVDLWRSRRFDWGLGDRDEVQLAYADALAMARAVVERDGGVPALRRLGSAFAALASGGWTRAEVRAAFRSALRRSFDEVEGQALQLAVEDGA